MRVCEVVFWGLFIYQAAREVILKFMMVKMRKLDTVEYSFQELPFNTVQLYFLQSFQIYKDLIFGSQVF